MTKPEWYPRNVIGGFEDAVETAQPSLTQAQFETDVRQYLEDRKLAYQLSSDVLARLFKMTTNCLGQMEELSKKRPLVEGDDWKQAKRVLRRLIDEELPEVLSNLKKDSDLQLPQTHSLVQSLISQFEELREDLGLTMRFAEHDEGTVSSYLRPLLPSQLMLDLDSHLRKKLPEAKGVQRRMIIAACVTAAGLFPNNDDDLDGVILSRIHRAQESINREAEKWKWGELDDYALPIPDETYGENKK